MHYAKKETDLCPYRLITLEDTIFNPPHPHSSKQAVKQVLESNLRSYYNFLTRVCVFSVPVPSDNFIGRRPIDPVRNPFALTISTIPTSGGSDQEPFGHDQSFAPIRDGFVLVRLCDFNCRTPPWSELNPA